MLQESRKMPSKVTTPPSDASTGSSRGEQRGASSDVCRPQSSDPGQGFQQEHGPDSFRLGMRAKKCDARWLCTKRKLPVGEGEPHKQRPW